MTRFHALIFVFALLALASVAKAKPLNAGTTSPPPVSHCVVAVETAPLPALQIEVCKSCDLSREDVSAMERGYAMAAYAAGYRIDALRTTQIRVVETGMLENHTPYLIGETMDMRFRVGDPHAGETLGSVVGRMVFLIVSGEL